MSVPPEGAQLSDDGRYWWDEQNQQWQEVTHDGPLSPEADFQWDGTQWQPVSAGSGQGAGAGGPGAGTAEIVFADIYARTENVGAAPMLDIDPDDNPDGHYTPHVGCGIQAVWADFNRGTADAQNYSDTWTLSGDGPQSGTVDNLDLPVGHGDMRKVSLGRLGAGHYDFTATLNGGVSLSHLNFEVEA